MQLGGGEGRGGMGGRRGEGGEGTSSQLEEVGVRQQFQLTIPAGRATSSRNDKHMHVHTHRREAEVEDASVAYCLFLSLTTQLTGHCLGLWDVRGGVG